MEVPADWKESVNAEAVGQPLLCAVERLASLQNELDALRLPMRAGWNRCNVLVELVCSAVMEALEECYESPIG